MKKTFNLNSFFNHNLENQIKNIIIYKSDDKWTISQNYKKVTTAEHLIWQSLYNKTYKLAYQNGIKMYRDGLDALNEKYLEFGFKMPDLNEISKTMNDATLWRIKPVAGFVDETIFFKLISQSYFPSSDIIRLSNRFREKYKGLNVKNNLSYTPEPDIFHEIFGHAPFLFNKKYCKLLNDIGKLGCDILFNMNFSDDLKYHNLKRLQNFVWWTLEFGVILNNTNNDFEILGAGILSSIDEINNVINSISNKKKYAKIIKYDIEKVIFTCFDYSNLQDRYFFVNSFDLMYDSFYSNKDIFLYKGN